MTTTPHLRPITPLIQLEHLVLSRIWWVKPTLLHAFFDCLACHHVPLRKLECRNLYNYKNGMNMYSGPAADLWFGIFSTLTSLTVY